MSGKDSLRAMQDTSKRMTTFLVVIILIISRVILQSVLKGSKPGEFFWRRFADSEIFFKDLIFQKRTRKIPLRFPARELGSCDVN